MKLREINLNNDRKEYIARVRDWLMNLKQYKDYLTFNIIGGHNYDTM